MHTETPASAGNLGSISKPADKLDQFRELLRAVDPAALTNADRGALLDLVAAAFAAAGVE